MKNLKNLDTFETFKPINENDNSSNENVVVTVYLDSPYKMGKGWTESQENQHRLKTEFFHIVSSLHLSPSETEDGVIIGEKKFDKSRLIKAYMHPMELTFTYTEYNQSDIEQMKHFVQKAVEELNIMHFPISVKEIRMKDSKGDYSNVK